MAVDQTFVYGRGYDGGQTLQDFRSGPIGSMLGMDWLQMMVARGFGWHADFGSFSTGITGGGAGTIIDLDQPEAIISVPSGFVLCPLRLAGQVKPVTTTVTDANEDEILFAADRSAAYAGDGTVVAVTPTNMRSDLLGASCPATVKSTASADITDPVLGIELARKVVTWTTQTAVGEVQTELSLVYEPLRPPFLIGPAAIYGYWGGTVALTGFAQADFLVFPSTLLTGLS